jgi:hypothetical protein
MGFNSAFKGLIVNNTLTKYAADSLVDEPLFPHLNIP